MRELHDDLNAGTARSGSFFHRRSARAPCRTELRKLLRVSTPPSSPARQPSRARRRARRPASERSRPRPRRHGPAGAYGLERKSTHAPCRAQDTERTADEREDEGFEQKRARHCPKRHQRLAGEHPAPRERGARNCSREARPSPISRVRARGELGRFPSSDQQLASYAEIAIAQSRNGSAPNVLTIFVTKTVLSKASAIPGDRRGAHAHGLASRGSSATSKRTSR